VYGMSVTFASVSRRAVLGCDGTRRPTEHPYRWCGVTAGELRRGRLSDPRLDVACRTDDGVRVAFVWLEPRRDARYVTVDQSGFVEVYAVAGHLPVRVATTGGVDASSLSSRWEVSEYSAAGRRLRTYVVDAIPAG